MCAVKFLRIRGEKKGKIRKKFVRANWKVFIFLKTPPTEPDTTFNGYDNSIAFTQFHKLKIFCKFNFALVNLNLLACGRIGLECDWSVSSGGNNRINPKSRQSNARGSSESGRAANYISELAFNAVARMCRASAIKPFTGLSRAPMWKWEMCNNELLSGVSFTTAMKRFTADVDKKFSTLPRVS